MWEARIYVTLKKGVLDPQGAAVGRALEALGYGNVSDVRIGKFIVLKMEDSSEEGAKAQVEEMCRRLLANTVIEDYSYEIVEIRSTELLERRMA